MDSLKRSLTEKIVKDMVLERDKIIERLKDIDNEIESQYEVKTKVIHNNITGSFRTKRYKVPKDPYQIRALNSERNALIKKLDELSTSVVDKNIVTQENNADDIEGEALKYGIDLYISNEKPKRFRKVYKRRSIARQVVDKYFPELKGRERENKIDSYRGRIYSALQKRYNPNM
jgi:hypothetical protein